jgi:hypothetical protein
MEKGDRSIKEPRQKEFKPEVEITETKCSDLVFRMVRFFQNT